MTVDVEVSAVIRRPVEEVSAYATDPRNAPTWYRRIESADLAESLPLKEGSTIDFRARFLGRRLHYRYEVTELQEGQRLTMRTSEGPFPMNTVYTWQPAEDGSTLMTLRNHGEPSGFSRLAAPLISVSMRRAMRQDLRQLTRILEQNQPSKPHGGA